MEDLIAPQAILNEDTSKNKVNESKDAFFVDSYYESYVYTLAEDTDNYWENENPTVGDWIDYFNENFSTDLNIPSSTPNQTEFDQVVDDYLMDFFSTTFVPSSNDFRDTWLSNVSTNTVLKSSEKNLICNAIYVTSAFGHIVSNNRAPIEAAHPWDVACNS